MEGRVRSEVVFDVVVVRTSAFELVANFGDRTRQETVFVVLEILLDGWAIKIEESGAITETRSPFTGEVTGEDLLLERIESIWNALQIRQVRDS